RKANKMGAAYVLMLGKDEQQKGEVLVKNMANSTEQRVAQIDLAAHLK
ncbi:histidine--tRNA ligase, partial [Candidatus Dependentiae bacterium]|nr:histidine--tRNA ligase [Candidatus Dependentiae bacterium]